MHWFNAITLAIIAILSCGVAIGGWVSLGSFATSDPAPATSLAPGRGPAAASLDLSDDPVAASLSVSSVVVGLGALGLVFTLASLYSSGSSLSSSGSSSSSAPASNSSIVFALVPPN